MRRNSVVVIGSGMMGSGIAAVSALAGEPTLLVDIDPGRALAGVRRAGECVAELRDSGLATPEAAEKACGLLAAAMLEEALPQAGFVIEAIAENLAAKQEMFRGLDAALPPELPIVSNTSGLRITEIAEHTAHPERTMTAHFWFPGHLVPLVEVVMGERTDERLANAVVTRLRRWGKSPVLVRRDLPGQLANRMLQALIREAVNIVQIGLASPEDVDTAVKMGMGIRLPAWGVLEHVDGVGVDLCRSVQDTVLPGISAASGASPLFAEMVEKGQLGHKSGKGFYDWSVRDMESLAAGRNRFIIEARKILQGYCGEETQ